MRKAHPESVPLEFADGYDYPCSPRIICELPGLLKTVKETILSKQQLIEPIKMPMKANIFQKAHDWSIGRRCGLFTEEQYAENFKINNWKTTRTFAMNFFQVDIGTMKDLMLASKYLGLPSLYCAAKDFLLFTLISSMIVPDDHLTEVRIKKALKLNWFYCMKCPKIGKCFWGLHWKHFVQHYELVHNKENDYICTCSYIRPYKIIKYPTFELLKEHQMICFGKQNPFQIFPFQCHGLILNLIEQINFKKSSDTSIDLNVLEKSFNLSDSEILELVKTESKLPPPSDVNEKGLYTLYHGDSFQSRFIKNEHFSEKEFIILCSVSTCKAPFKNYHELEKHEEACKKAVEELRLKTPRKCKNEIYGCKVTWMTDDYAKGELAHKYGEGMPKCEIDVKALETCYFCGGKHSRCDRFDHLNYINKNIYGCPVFRRTPEKIESSESDQRVKDENELTEMIRSVPNPKKWKNFYKKQPSELDRKLINNIFGTQYLQSKYPDHKAKMIDARQSESGNDSDDEDSDDEDSDDEEEEEKEISKVATAKNDKLEARQAKFIALLKIKEKDGFPFENWLLLDFFISEFLWQNRNELKDLDSPFSVEACKRLAKEIQNLESYFFMSLAARVDISSLFEGLDLYYVISWQEYKKIQNPNSVSFKNLKILELYRKSEM